VKLTKAPILLAALLMSGTALAQGASIAHINLMRIWRQGEGTPGREGYLPLARDEARTALLHANKAIDAGGDQAQVNTELGDVVHALNPEHEAQGPGNGYGLTRAAVSILAQMQVAASRPDASGNVKAASQFVIPAADHVAQLSREARILADDVRANPGQAAGKVTALRDHIAEAISGRDADGNGEITATEAGLTQITQKMADLLKAEGF
jgi:hypothetical protein